MEFRIRAGPRGSWEWCKTHGERSTEAALRASAPPRLLGVSDFESEG
jgi:hypothetical protein